MNAAIETFNLTRDFGSFRAVDQLNLRVEAGCFYGFLGPNGAGKSTTIKMLTGLLAPTAGSVRILGEEAVSGGNSKKLCILFPTAKGLGRTHNVIELLEDRGLFIDHQFRITDDVHAQDVRDFEFRL